MLSKREWMREFNKIFFEYDACALIWPVLSTSGSDRCNIVENYSKLTFFGYSYLSRANVMNDEYYSNLMIEQWSFLLYSGTWNRAFMMKDTLTLINWTWPYRFVFRNKTFSRFKLTTTIRKYIYCIQNIKNKQIVDKIQSNYTQKFKKVITHQELDWPVGSDYDER